MRTAEQEALYVKESMARLTVEVAKRMWPQFWESFLADLDVLSRCGVSGVHVFRCGVSGVHVFRCGVSGVHVFRCGVSGVCSGVE